MEIKKEIRIKALPARVFSALTDSNQLSQWFPDVASIEPKIGGKISFRFLESRADNFIDKDYVMEGKIIELVKDKKLVYTWGYPDNPKFPLTQVSWTLDEVEDGITKVTIAHTGFIDEIIMKPYNEQWDWFTGRLNAFTNSSKHKDWKQLFLSIQGLNIFAQIFSSINPAKGKVNIALQMILTCIPFVDVWTFYRIKKLRRYLTILVPVILVISSIMPLVIVGPEYFDNKEWRECVTENGFDYCFENVGMYGEPCKPNWALYWHYNTCEPEELRNTKLIFNVSILVMAVYLIRRWSGQWNNNALHNVKV